MKKIWRKPEIEVVAAGMEVTSYSSADIDDGIIIDPEILY